MLTFFKAPHDLEIEASMTIFNLMYSTGFKEGDEDKLLWAPSKKEMFNTWSFYNVFIPHDKDKSTY